MRGVFVSNAAFITVMVGLGLFSSNPIIAARRVPALRLSSAIDRR